MAASRRPLSPHLGIYGWYLTMALSIGHRVTGGALVVGLLLFTWWLLALAGGPDSFATAQAVTGSFLGGLVLFLLTPVYWYHFLNGIRHLVWDVGYNLSKVGAHQSGIWVLIGTAALTVLTWIAILLVG